MKLLYFAEALSKLSIGIHVELLSHCKICSNGHSRLTKMDDMPIYMFG